MRKILLALFAMLVAAPTALAAPKQADVRFSTFNASLNRNFAGQFVSDISTPNNQQAKNAAETIQRVRPDVLLINEFDYDAAGTALRLFQDNYLSIGQNGAAPIVYPYRYAAESNTGIPTGLDVDNSGTVGGPNDAYGFGFFPGQFGMAVYSMYPIDQTGIRTFQKFLWKDMPGALLPDNPATPAPADWYSPSVQSVFRLSSKSHWDLPLLVGGKVVHFLVSHPTPPVFDDPPAYPAGVDFNGRRNYDEIRFWADYISPGKAGYIYDDAGGTGGLKPGSLFVIAGDQNSDPLDGGQHSRLDPAPARAPAREHQGDARQPWRRPAERSPGRGEPDPRFRPAVRHGGLRRHRARQPPGRLRAAAEESADRELPASSGRWTPIRSSGSSERSRSRPRTTGWSGSTRPFPRARASYAATAARSSPTSWQLRQRASCCSFAPPGAVGEAFREASATPARSARPRAAWSR